MGSPNQCCHATKLVLVVLLLLNARLSSDLLAQGEEQLVAGAKAGQEWSLKSLRMSFCWCPAGKFTMGSLRMEPGRRDNEGQVEVVLARGFWMGKYEVTQAEWLEVMGKNPGEVGKRRPKLPAYPIRWDAASAFCAKLNEQERQRGTLPKGWEFRLPTEAQWEYACRAGTTTAFSFGDDRKQFGDYGWYRENVNDGPSDVGLKKPNPWGLCDMHGNVWEWCRDYYQQKLPGGTDPEVTEKSDHHVYRGGSFLYPDTWCRSAFRFGSLSTAGASSLGFRVALVQINP